MMNSEKTSANAPNTKSPNEQKGGQHSMEIDSTIASVEELVKKESVSGASGAITKWIEALSSHKELKGIAGNLEKLKEAISAKNGKKIVELMTTLGEETTKASMHAEGDESQKIKNLGKTLSTAAKAISKFA
jgi:hypothetical protein